ncbi:glycerophosphoryl diester phosphodiesterase membrane domain-containing protein [Demequina lutea]|uniref:MFS family permease n=1 Tax=Demequina lutea TaxID=431489 RepID=A0A7Y9Z8J5_9MICO|nr:glycerophosphoryl diester phosphodiesterase membrane domain-containing protein [Demequina lutea]NYI40797.1 MFS family permease [Demequina lutea]
MADNSASGNEAWASPEGGPQGWASPETAGSGAPMPPTPDGGWQANDPVAGAATGQQYPYPPAGPNAADAYSRYKPGIIVLRPLGFGQILDGGIKALRHNPKVMIGLNGAVTLAATVAMFGLGYQYFSSAFSFDTSANSQTFSPGSIISMVAGYLVATLLLTMVTVISSVSVGRSVIGDVITPRDAWKRSMRRMPTVLAITLLMLLAILLGYAVVAGLVIVSALVATWLAIVVGLLGVLGLIVLFVWLGIKLSITLPASVLERLGPVASMRRSWRLTTGRFWMILSVLLVATIITSFIQSFASAPVYMIMPFMFLNSDSPPAGLMLVVLAVASYVGMLASTVFVASVTAVVYTDQRMRREGFDLVLAQASVRQGA